MQIFKKMYNLYTEAAGKTRKNPTKTALLFSCLRDVRCNNISSSSIFWKGSRKLYNLDSSVKNSSVLELFLPRCHPHRRHYFVLCRRASSTNWQCISTISKKQELKSSNLIFWGGEGWGGGCLQMNKKCFIQSNQSNISFYSPLSCLQQ